VSKRTRERKKLEKTKLYKKLFKQAEKTVDAERHTSTFDRGQRVEVVISQLLVDADKDKLKKKQSLLASSGNQSSGGPPPPEKRRKRG
jgi:hypothetical protein